MEYPTDEELAELQGLGKYFFYFYQKYLLYFIKSYPLLFLLQLTYHQHKVNKVLKMYQKHHINHYKTTPVLHQSIVSFTITHFYPKFQ